MGLRELIGNFAEKMGGKMTPDAEDFGYTEAEVKELTEEARGSFEEQSLIGATKQKSPLSILQDNEQPHFIIPGSDFAAEGDGREIDGGAGNMIFTSDRLIFDTASGVTGNRSAITYSDITSVGIKRGITNDRLTIQIPSRSLTMKTGAEQWGEELKQAGDYIQSKSGISSSIEIYEDPQFDRTN